MTGEKGKSLVLQKMTARVSGNMLQGFKNNDFAGDLKKSETTNVYPTSKTEKISKNSTTTSKAQA